MWPRRSPVGGRRAGDAFEASTDHLEWGAPRSSARSPGSYLPGVSKRKGSVKKIRDLNKIILNLPVFKMAGSLSEPEIYA